MGICLFFLLFGVQTLVTAFSLNDPFSFVLTFFASNFIILISAALMIGFTFRQMHHRKVQRAETPESPNCKNRAIDKSADNGQNGGLPLE